MRTKLKIPIFIVAILIFVTGLPFFAYQSKLDLNDLSSGKWSDDEFRQALTITRGGFRGSFKNISTEERKILRDSKSLTTEDIVREDGELSKLDFETDRSKIKIVVNQVIKKIKSYDSKYKANFEVTIYRLMKILKHV